MPVSIFTVFTAGCSDNEFKKKQFFSPFQNKICHSVGHVHTTRTEPEKKTLGDQAVAL